MLSCYGRKTLHGNWDSTQVPTSLAYHSILSVPLQVYISQVKVLDTAKVYHVFMFNTCVNRITGHLVSEGFVKLWDICTWPQYSTINVLFSV